MYWVQNASFNSLTQPLAIYRIKPRSLCFRAMVQIQQHLITVIHLMIQVIKPTIKSCQLKVKLLQLIIKVYHLMTKVCQLLITFLFIYFLIMTKVYQISITIYQQLTDEGLPSEDSGFSTTTKSVWFLTEAFKDRLPPERYWRDEYPTRRVGVVDFPHVTLSPPAWLCTKTGSNERYFNVSLLFQVTTKSPHATPCAQKGEPKRKIEPLTSLTPYR